MKSFLLLGLAGLLGLTLTAAGQSQQTTTGQVMGRGRGGVPYAWNDQNKDGICDLTGRPVGQGGTAAVGFGRGRGGAPFAWNDKDKDGVCDITGRPVGQGRAFAVGRGRGRGMRGSGWRAMGRRPVVAPAQIPQPQSQP